MITITDAALTKIKQIADDEGIGHYCLRVKVLSGGCSGLKHELDFDNNIAETDETFDFGDIKIVIDTMSFQYLDGANIDFVDTLIGAGFKVNVLNSTSCGCGNSWSV